MYQSNFVNCNKWQPNLSEVNRTKHTIVSLQALNHRDQVALLILDRKAEEVKEVATWTDFKKEKIMEV